MTDELVTATEARDRFGVPLHRTHLWASRKNVTMTHGYRGRQRLYSANELKDLNQLANFDPRSKK